MLFRGGTSSFIANYNLSLLETGNLDTGLLHHRHAGRSGGIVTNGSLLLAKGNETGERGHSGNKSNNNNSDAGTDTTSSRCRHARVR